MTQTLTKKPQRSSKDLPSDEEIEVGQWYWVQGDKHDDALDRGGCWLGCVVHVGSNYAELKGVCYIARVHLDEFWDVCEREHRPQDFIENQRAKYQKRVAKLMARVHEITAKLAVAPSPELQSGTETKALATLNSGSGDLKGYEKALVKAKDKTLPALFKEIERANKALAEWMCADLIPLKAKARGMEKVIDVIKGRIFNVELYAGLSEKVVQITEGDCAAVDAKVHLLQRRHYMDEECLLAYQTGGMSFKDIEEFDQWLAVPANRDRILPFPRCVVAFKVRRNSKQQDRPYMSLSEFINFLFAYEADKQTFLYLRNGDNLYRMDTAIEFDKKLFPDLDRQKLGGKLWARMFADRVDRLITDDERQGLLEEEEREEAERLRKLRTCPQKDRWRYQGSRRQTVRDYEPFDQSNVHYDDIAAHIAGEIQQHNRIALILQGLLDRSPVFHPHPPWRTWEDDGFRSAFELVYDESRALVAGAAPDFEAYRTRLNASLKTGSLTVGQQEAWERYAAEKDYEKQVRRRGYEKAYRHTRLRPYGNPGPGDIARIEKWQPRKRRATYVWERERLHRQWRSDSETVPTSYTVDAKDLLNVDAYTPGGYLQFFQDPRTRANYLQWAPLLLMAEEYHAGNRKVGPDDS